jgi:hypothetical protein
MYTHKHKIKVILYIYIYTYTRINTRMRSCIAHVFTTYARYAIHKVEMIIHARIPHICVCTHIKNTAYTHCVHMYTYMYILRTTYNTHKYKIEMIIYPPYTYAHKSIYAYTHVCACVRSGVCAHV